MRLSGTRPGEAQWGGFQDEGRACAKAWRTERPMRLEPRAQDEAGQPDPAAWGPDCALRGTGTSGGFQVGERQDEIWFCALLWLRALPAHHGCSDWQPFGALRIPGARGPARLGWQGCGPRSRNAPSSQALPAAGGDTSQISRELTSGGSVLTRPVSACLSSLENFPQAPTVCQHVPTAHHVSPHCTLVTSP